jgi:hypothetical protein
MAFTYPSVLYAFFLLLIPIVIHLFNFRRYKKVYFSNLRFLTSVNQQSRKTSQLKHLLILLARLLFVSALVLAFSKPYIPSKLSKLELAKRHVVFYLDNSFSMQQEGKKGCYLKKRKALF